MRIIKRSEFMQLPEGTIFCKGKPWSFHGPCCKGATISDPDGRAIDWYYRDLTDVDMEPRTEYIDTLEKMLASGHSRPLEEAEMRDGCFAEDDVFLVYELDDLEELYSVIGRAAAMAASIEIDGEIAKEQAANTRRLT